MYGVEKSMDMMKKLKDLIHKLIQQYLLEHPISHSSSNSTNSSTFTLNMASQYNDDKCDKGDDWDDEFRKKNEEKTGWGAKNELDKYLEDDVVDDHIEFNIWN